MPYIPDPNHPNVKHAAAVIGELLWDYLTTRTPAEIEEMQRRVRRDREIRRLLFDGPDQHRELNA